MQAEFGPVDKMPDPQFWGMIGLINGTGWHDNATDLEPLKAALKSLDDLEICAFEEALSQKLFALDTRHHYRSFSWFPGLSDTFLYKRLAVVAQEEDYFTKVLNIPHKFPWRSTKWLEGLLYVAREAFEEKYGRDLDYSASICCESFSNAKGWQK
ncbi:DUF4240 domain-containing protein [Parasedimentitalea maritima]|uniref:DUF4240 domain-containing protein n=1 Tax=Parasedimentitalea maritima TaxID=2578117 RepID=A0A6A4RI24_9RHOB|nr:DUF4240 domain-containing protein [Zongyanglinia marina]KAE9629594.1 DUF4240 domain-containing protein [Zongyanglinia marina]